METVVVLGASSRPDRYSYQAVSLLKEKGHKVIPISLHDKEILGIPCLADLSQITGKVDTLTVYVGPHHSAPLLSKIISISPKRVIFNPGAENPPLYAELEKKGIQIEEACTLVLLRIGSF